MGGPIVRTGTTPEFWNGWDRVFGDKSGKKSGSGGETAAAGGKSAGKKSAAKKVAAKKPAAKKAARKK